MDNKKGLLTLKPTGGLGNRILAIDSTISLCREIQFDLKIIWLINGELNAGFHELFLPISLKGIEIEFEEVRDRLFLYSDRILNKPKQRIYNSIIRIWQRFHFGKVLHSYETSELYKSGFDFKSLVKYRKPYVVAWGRIESGDIDPGSFVPTLQIKEMVESQAPKLNYQTIGVHIRRGDHQQVIENSPLELFIEQMELILVNEPEIQFYVASDSSEVKKILRERFNDHVVFSSVNEADRASLGGMKDALVDILILSRTKRILGNSMSTFSVVASQLGKIPLEHVSLQTSEA